MPKRNTGYIHSTNPSREWKLIAKISASCVKSFDAATRIEKPESPAVGCGWDGEEKKEGFTIPGHYMIFFTLVSKLPILENLLMLYWFYNVIYRRLLAELNQIFLCFTLSSI